MPLFAPTGMPLILELSKLAISSPILNCTAAAATVMGARGCIFASFRPASLRQLPNSELNPS